MTDCQQAEGHVGWLVCPTHNRDVMNNIDVLLPVQELRAENARLRTVVEAQAVEVARIKANHVTVVEETQRRHDAVVPKIVEIARLRTVVEAQGRVVSAAQKFFGRDGSRWFDRPECALRVPIASREGLPRCTCGGHDMGRALAALDKATTPSDEAVRSFRMGD